MLFWNLLLFLNKLLYSLFKLSFIISIFFLPLKSLSFNVTLIFPELLLFLILNNLALLFILLSILLFISFNFGNSFWFSSFGLKNLIFDFSIRFVFVEFLLLILLVSNSNPFCLILSYISSCVNIYRHSLMAFRISSETVILALLLIYFAYFILLVGFESKLVKKASISPLFISKYLLNCLYCFKKSISRLIFFR